MCSFILFAALICCFKASAALEDNNLPEKLSSQGKSSENANSQNNVQQDNSGNEQNIRDVIIFFQHPNGGYIPMPVTGTDYTVYNRVY